MSNTIITLIILILLSGFFSGVEIAFFSLSLSKTAAMVRRGLYGAKTVEKLKGNPQRLLVVILLGNNIVNILAAALATKFALEIFGSTGIAIATGSLTLLILIFGEIFPKAVAQAHAETIARFSSRPVLFLQYLLFPLVFLFEILSKVIVKLTLGKKKLILISEEEIRAMLQLGVKEGSLQAHEQTFVENLFRFNDISIQSITTPIKKVIMLDAEAPIENISHFAANSGYSRFPLFLGSKKNIVAMVHIKDIIKADNSRQRSEALISIAKPLIFISKEEKLYNTFKRMQKEHFHQAIVTGDKGSIVGMITLEDLLEELVGEIQDESDARKLSSTT